MNAILRNAYETEIEQAKHHYELSHYDKAFYHLERAHILGQSYVIPHTVSHWWMLKTGWVMRDWSEVFGQIPRLLASLIISRIWVPLGNNGRANVSAIKSMPITEDLENIFDTALKTDK